MVRDIRLPTKIEGRMGTYIECAVQLGKRDIPLLMRFGISNRLLVQRSHPRSSQRDFQYSELCLIRSGNNPKRSHKRDIECILHQKEETLLMLLTKCLPSPYKETTINIDSKPMNAN